MWGRAIEIMLGLWLVLSPWIFRHWDSHRTLSWVVIACGFFLVVVSSAAFWRPLRRAHLVHLGVALGLAAYAYFGFPHPAPPGAQNALLTGLVLILIAIIPPRPTDPPEPWREFLEERAREGFREGRGRTVP